MVVPRMRLRPVIANILSILFHDKAANKAGVVPG